MSTVRKKGKNGHISDLGVNRNEGWSQSARQRRGAADIGYDSWRLCPRQSRDGHKGNLVAPCTMETSRLNRQRRRLAEGGAAYKRASRAEIGGGAEARTRH